MRIQSISPKTSNYNQLRVASSQQNVNFKNIYNPKLIINRVNPLMMFVDKEYKNSVKASRIFWAKPSKDIEKLVNEISIFSGKKKKLIAWDMENEKKNNKYVIVLHGLSHNISSLELLYKMILKNTKFSVLAPEYYGLTHEDKQEIYMDPVSMTQDVESSIKYLKDKGVDEKDIYILGHSFGGYIATRTAQKNKNIGGLILVSTLDTMFFNAKGYGNSWSHNPSRTVERMLENKNNIVLRSLSKILGVDRYIKNSEVPIDIIHSKKDGIAPVENIEKIASKSKNINNMIILNSGKHRMDNDKMRAVVSLLNNK